VTISSDSRSVLQLDKSACFPCSEKEGGVRDSVVYIRPHELWSPPGYHGPIEQGRSEQTRSARV